MRYIVLMISLIVGMTMHSAKSQCSDNSENKCLPPIDKYVVLKNIKVDIKKPAQKSMAPKVRFTYMFSKGNTYRIDVCGDINSNEEPLVVTIIDNKAIIASSMDNDTKKANQAILFKCKKTGIYYLSYNFLSGGGCGDAVISFIKP